MTSASRAAELRALADKIEATEELAAQAAEAKQAYADVLAGGDEDQIADARQRHREASDALNAARAETRQGPIVGSAEPGSATVRVGALSGGVG